jgi:isopenicillin N synthase-like dioxygenase
MSIPIIDFDDPNHLKHIEEAYTTVGFAVFKNCLSVKERTTLNYWFVAMKQFFDLSLETKKLYSYQTENNLGYSIMGAENVDPTAPKDMKESFNFNDTRMPDKLWPHGWVPGFQYKALETVKIADRLTLDILKKFDTILSSGTTLVDSHQEMYNTTRIIHYPAYEGTLEDRQMRIGEHSDYGTITLLWQITDVPGLEVQDLNGEWHPVPYGDLDGVVVNIGDLLQRWTNDYFVSTKHRVVNSHIHLPRYSMPHFVDPSPGTIVKNLTSGPDKYEPIESKEYLMWRLAQSY